MRIAIATSKEDKGWYQDIDLLIAALAKYNAMGEYVVWDDRRIDWAVYDAILIDSVWDYTEHYLEFISWCEAVLLQSKLMNSYDVVKLSSNKNYLLTLQNSGLCIPRTKILTASNMNDLSSIHEFRNRVVIKPVIGADGVGTYLFANIQAIINSSTTAHLKSGNAWLLQDYVPEIKTLGEIGAIYIGGKLSHCVLKKPAGKDFRVQHQYGGTAELTEAPHYVDALYHDVVSALDISPTYMRLDFIPTTTPMIMEVEMVEPHKYFALCPEGAIKLAQCLVA